MTSLRIVDMIDFQMAKDPQFRLHGPPVCPNTSVTSQIHQINSIFKNVYDKYSIFLSQLG